MQARSCRGCWAWLDGVQNRHLLSSWGHLGKEENWTGKARGSNIYQFLPRARRVLS